QLSAGSFASSVNHAIRRNGLMPSSLSFEITESVLMEDVEFSIESLVGLKGLGVRLAVDDFGTGYSSLAYLKRLPLDSLKIDGASCVTLAGGGRPRGRPRGRRLRR